MTKLKTCPLCGRKANIETIPKLFSEDKNMFSNKWLGTIRILVFCKKCGLMLDKVYTDEYESTENALQDFEKATERVVQMWNRRAKDDTEAKT